MIQPVEGADIAVGDEPGTAFPPEFLAAVKDALDHLYDLDKLNRHPLIHWLHQETPPHGVSRAQALRQLLLDAIESMKPRGRVSSSAPQYRAFHLLELRFVEAMPFREAMRTLALSQSQYHREQRRAVHMLATHLWDTCASRPAAGVESLANGGDPARGRRDAADAPPRPDLAANREDDEVELSSFLQEIANLLVPLAQARQGQITLVPTEQSAAVLTNRVALRHAVIAAAEYLLELATGASVWIALRRVSPGVRLELGAKAPPGREEPASHSPAAREKLVLAGRLMRSIGGSLVTMPHASEQQQPLVSLCFPARRISLLVVEDNQDMIQLIARFLADEPYAVSSATSVEAGLRAAETVHPDIIVLDVMMPHRDGWEALQLFRHHPATADTPVVVCTVLADETLARALGAAAFIRKPLTRAALLQVLDRGLSHRSLAAAEPPAAPARLEASC